MDVLARVLAHPATIGPRAVAVGLSMGASWAMWLRESFLGHCAEIDEFEPLDAVRELEEQIRGAGRDVTFHAYPSAKHWFFESDVPGGFDPAAAEIAWTRTLEFLGTALPDDGPA
jgi:dienelactone hydrolase